MLKVTLFIYILLLGIPVYSQEYLVKNYTPDPENTVSAIYSISQDKQGFIWLSSSRGVFRFDGKNFKQFSLPATIPANLVRKIICDSKGMLWFATTRNGIFSYSSGKIYCYDNSRILKNISDIIEINGNIFAGCGQELYSFNKKNFSRVKAFPSSILSFAADRKGNLWIVTSNNRLYSYNLRSNKLTEENSHLYPTTPSKLKSVYFDSRGNTLYSLHDKAIITDRREKFTISFQKSSEKNFIKDLLEDSEGNLWFCNTGGLYICKGMKTERINISKHPVDNVCLTIFEDREKNIWVGSAGSLTKVSKNEFRFLDNELTALKSFHFIMEDSKGRLWFSSNEKIRCLNNKVKNGDQGKEYTVPVLKRSQYYSAGTEDKSGNLWFASVNGLLKYDGKIFSQYINKTFFEQRSGDFRHNPYTEIRDVRSVAKGSNGFLYILYDYNLISEFNGKSFRNFYLKSDSLKYCELLYNIFHQSWFYSGGEFLKVYVGKNYKNINIKSDPDALKMPAFEDKKFIWITEEIPNKGENYLIQIDKTDGKVHKYNKSMGVPSGILHAITTDKLGHMWFFIRGKGFAKFDVGDYYNSGEIKFYYYFYNDKIKDVLNSMTFTDHNGNIWLGSMSGWVRLNPNEFEKNEPVVPDPVLLSVKLVPDNKELQMDNSSEGSELSYDKNNLSFEYISPNSRNNEHTTYKYMLEGFDKQWSTPGLSTEAVYTNLPPGKYRFVVRACFNNAVFSKNTASYLFIISPPYWKTWWFYLITFSCISGLYFFVLRIRANIIQKKVLENLVMIRTKQLQEEKERVEIINSELEKNRYQLFKINEIQTKWLEELSDSEQHLRELNNSKDTFFSIISHDLKSPFNSLINYTDSFLDNFHNMNPELIKEYTLNLNRSTKNVYELIEKLLDWSKMQTGRFDCNPCTYDIKIQADQISILHSGNFKKKRIMFVNKIKSGTFINADENMIRSVINNLLSNAVKFTREGGRITLSAFNTGNYVEISVTDTGVGISKEDIQKLFKIDHRFTTLGTQKEKGTGLGLILCKELIEKNGGKIYVESISGTGSTFYFTLPSGDSIAQKNKASQNYCI